MPTSSYDSFKRTGASVDEYDPRDDFIIYVFVYRPIILIFCLVVIQILLFRLGLVV